MTIRLNQHLNITTSMKVGRIYYRAVVLDCVSFHVELIQMIISTCLLLLWSTSSASVALGKILLTDLQNTVCNLPVFVYNDSPSSRDKLTPLPLSQSWPPGPHDETAHRVWLRREGVVTLKLWYWCRHIPLTGHTRFLQLRSKVAVWKSFIGYNFV